MKTVTENGTVKKKTNQKTKTPTLYLSLEKNARSVLPCLPPPLPKPPYRFLGSQIPCAALFQAAPQTEVFLKRLSALENCR